MASEACTRSVEPSTHPLAQDTLGSHLSPSQTGSPRSPRCILVEDVLEHLSCGLCRGPVASSLILSCSHLFCGDCLWQHLQKRQSCPTCSMALRAVPVRCLAMDKVAASIVPSLPQQQQQQYAKRYKDGQCTADKVNKMFWWLAPAALPPGGPMAPATPAGAPPATCPPLVAAPALPGTAPGPAGLSLDLQLPSSSRPGQPSGLPCPAPSPFVSLLPAMSGAAPGLPHIPAHLAAANAAANTNQLLQLAAAAQQYATAQQMMQVQQQLGTAAALGNGTMPTLPQPIIRDAMSMQQMLMNVPHEQLGAGRVSYQDPLQLSAMISNICQV